MRHLPYIGNAQGEMRPCLRLCMSHSLVMYNRNHTCLVSSLFSVLVERLVLVVVKCLVKDQQVMGLFVQASFKSLSIFFFSSVEQIRSMDSYPPVLGTPASLSSFMHDVGIDVSWEEGLDVNESSLGARGDLIGGVNVFGDDAGNDSLEYLEHSFRGLSGLPQVGKGGRRSARRVLCRCGNQED